MQQLQYPPPYPFWPFSLCTHHDALHALLQHRALSTRQGAEAGGSLEARPTAPHAISAPLHACQARDPVTVCILTQDWAAVDFWEGSVQLIGFPKCISNIGYCVKFRSGSNQLSHILCLCIRAPKIASAPTSPAFGPRCHDSYLTLMR